MIGNNESEKHHEKKVLFTVRVLKTVPNEHRRKKKTLKQIIQNKTLTLS